MHAIVSDIHANLEALQAVLEDAQQQGAKEIVCLGDTLGYGPNPVECLELSADWSIVLRGHADDAVVCNEPLEGASHVYHRTLYWTRKQLRTVPGAMKHWAWLERLPKKVTLGHVQFVHGRPRDSDEYLFPEDVYCQRKMDAIGQQFDRQCFVGHSHLPGLFLQGPGDEWEFQSPQECGGQFSITKQKFICNVGAVGQPRDGDRRASYVLDDGQSVFFRRVEYDVQTTVKKIRDLDEFDNCLGDRLLSGR